uniref:FZ domain-containing protein n=1 Tax=Amphimedon queenslandica TaxID=400682 RepID=A0A1X7UEJ6_AMPQE
MSSAGKKKELVIARKIENVFFIVLLFVVLALFTVPIIVYYRSTSNTFESDNNNNGNFSEGGTISNNNVSQNCTRLSWSQDNDVSECHEYTGTACRNFLHQWFQCTIGEDELNIGVSQQEQNQHEGTIGSLSLYLEHYKQCQQQSSAFICQYFFPLADCSTGKSYKATKEDCLLISTGVCSDVWALANNFGYGSLLPDCSTLPNAANDSSSVPIPIEGINDTNGTDGIVCREDFVKTEFICEPICDSFEQTSHLNSQILIYSEVVATGLGLIFCVVTIIVAVKEYKTLLVYPSVLVFFQVLDMIVLVIVLIITAIDRYGLYCSSVSLLETLNNPTPFCKFSGVVFHYVIVNMALWWFFHVAMFFHKVFFPFQANRFEKLGREKYIFATVTILSLLLPLPAVIVCLSVDKFKYNVHRFPTTLCISDGDMWFYSTTLPMDILLAAGVIMLIMILWTMRKKTNFLNRNSRTKLSTAEKKILLVFTSFIVFGVYILGHVSDITAKSGKFQAALREYFECEAFGHIPGKCDRETFDKIYSPYTSVIAYILMSLIPLSILNFILKWSSVKIAKNKVIKLTRRHLSFLYHGKRSFVTSSESVSDELSSKS